MAIFRREEPHPPQVVSPPRRPAPTAAGGTTLIAPGSRVSGEIAGRTPVQIDGEFHGKVKIDQAVVVGPKGKVQGDLRARTVKIGGEMQGNIRAAERVELGASGVLYGDIVSPRVVIAEGAFFKGQVEMADKVDLKPSGSRRSPGKPSEGPPEATQSAEPTAATTERPSGHDDRDKPKAGAKGAEAAADPRQASLPRGGQG